MPDRYQRLATNRLGRRVVQRLGLPAPVPLRRFGAGETPAVGRVLLGGAGALLEPLREAVTAAGGVPVGEAGGEPLYAAVFDATAVAGTADLTGLTTFFSPVLRQVAESGRIVVVGRPPEHEAEVGSRAAQRALEGFTRSLGKEIGRGRTVQLVSVQRGAESRIGSTIGFLLSPRSAYVSGQVIRVGTRLDEPDVHGLDGERPLAGRVALVTGAARGIGTEIARVLHRLGAETVGVDVPAAAEPLHELMTALSGEAVLLDITAVDAPQRIARALRDRHGGGDVVVHNAGITRDRRLVNMDKDRWQSVIAVNLAAPERITAQLLDDDLLRPNGRIVGVASIAGLAGNAGQTNYATSKAGIVGLVEGLVEQAAARGLTVNAVAPGFIETQMTARMPAALRMAGRRMTSLGQGGLPVDVAETIGWLADPRSYGVTGNVVRVCGQSLLGA